MSFDYTSLRNSASRLIQKFGGGLTLYVVTKVENPDEPWNGSTTSVEAITGKGVFSKYQQKFIDGTVIQQGDQKLLLAAKDFGVDPDVTSYVVRDGETKKWSVVNVQKINPGETNLLYIVQVRA